jgi:2'-5' RNA ligase
VSQNTALARLFIETRLAEPDAHRLSRLREFDARLAEMWGSRLRWVHRDKLHLTWLFVGGAVPDDTIPLISQRLNNVLANRRQFGITYDSAEFWPKPRQPRQLVLTSSGSNAEAQSLASLLAEAVTAIYETDALDKFRPHVTLLRFDKHKPGGASGGARSVGRIELPDYLPLDQILPINQTIDNISLTRSHMNKTGADAYEQLATWNLVR